MDLTYLKLALLLVSLGGYILFIQKKGIEIAFAPALTVSGIGIVMFLAGLLNLMPQAAAAIFWGGLVLSVYAALTKYRPDAHSLAVLCFWAVSLLVLGILYRDAAFNGPDDFSHWALVVKNMLLTDRLPDSESILYYQNYPTGTAGFLYFVCKILGHSEPNMLRGQTILIVSSLCFLWAWVRGRYLLSGALIVPFSLYLLLCIGTARTLLVDVPLTALGTASFLILGYYRQDLKKSCICSCLILSYLVLVKNSTFFFVILHLVPALYFARSQKPSRLLAWGKILLLQVLVPVALYLLWDHHVDIIFESGDMARHSLSIPYLLETFSEKSFTDIRSIFVAFAYRSLKVGLEVPAFLVTLGVLVLGCIRHYLRDRKSHPTELWCLLWGVAAFGGWMVSLLAMYLFSMPYAEALTLSSYTRYVTSIAVYLLCITFVLLLHQLSSAPTLAVPKALLAGAAACMMLLTVRANLPSLHRNLPFKTQARETLTEIRQAYQIPDNASYFIVCDGWDVYVRFVGRYDFWSEAVFAESDPLNPADAYWQEVCDHLILLRDGPDVDQFLETLGLPKGEQYYYLPNY